MIKISQAHSEGMTAQRLLPADRYRRNDDTDGAGRDAEQGNASGTG